MALRFSNQSLEERLSERTEEQDFELIDLIQHKRERAKDCKSPYYAHDLISRILHYFRNNKQIQFGKEGSDGKSCYDYARTSLESINKEPLKPVERGTRIKGIPSDFLDSLDDFEKIYFLAGLSSNQKTATNVESLVPLMDSYEIASLYIRKGIDLMAGLHNSIAKETSNKRKVYRGNRRETYKNLWTPPKSKQIRKKILKIDEIQQRIKGRYENRVEEVKKLLSQESYLNRSPTDLLNAQSKADELEEINERIGIILDSCSNKEIRYLSQNFGRRALGEFYVA